MDKIYEAVKDNLRNDLPAFSSGDTVSVGVKVVEGNRSRVQIFEGTVIAISSGSNLSKTFTVRKISNGVGVERIFPLHSPNLDSVKVDKKGKVRRAKLYYLRKLSGKKARITEDKAKLKSIIEDKEVKSKDIKNSEVKNEVEKKENKTSDQKKTKDNKNKED